MIASIRGEVTVRRSDHVVVEAGGVGYALAVSAQTLRAVPAAGESAFLHTHLVLRDDGMQLYGFASEEERELFHLLIGVQGVGPKVALAVLSGGTARDLVRAIAVGDSARFQAAPGIGRRTAERIIVELREKVAEPGTADTVDPGASGDAQTVARDGLIGLGFDVREVDALLAKASGETPEELIAEALKGAR